MKAVLFDLDNVIYDELDYFSGVLKLFSKENNLPVELNSYIDRDLLMNSKDVFGDVLKKANLYTLEFHDKIFDLYKSVDVPIKPKKEVITLLEKLKDMGLVLGLITNGTVEAQKNKVRLLNIEKFFDCIVYARMFGKDKEKPHPLPFRYILSKLDIEPSQAIMVGDNPATDIFGAIRVGITPILYEGIVSTDLSKYKHPEYFKVIRITNILDIIDIVLETERRNGNDKRQQ